MNCSSLSPLRDFRLPTGSENTKLRRCGHAEVCYTTIGRPPAQSSDSLSRNPSHQPPFLSDTQGLTIIGRLHTGDDHSSVTRDGVVSVTYKTHWLGLFEPAWGREMDLQPSRNHTIRYSAGNACQYRRTNRFTTECASVRHNVSFLRTKANILSAQLRSRHAHTVDSQPPRHSIPSGSPLLVQGRRSVVVSWENQGEYD